MDQRGIPQDPQDHRAHEPDLDGPLSGRPGKGTPQPGDGSAGARHGHATCWREMEPRDADDLPPGPTGVGQDAVLLVAPILQRLLETDGKARALFLFPTKALSQDQSAALNA
jgi:hypothetical protein